MSIHLTSLVWDANLIPLQKLIMLTLADSADDNGYVGIINIEKFSKRVGATVGEVAFTIDYLFSQNLVSFSDGALIISPEKIKEIGR